MEISIKSRLEKEFDGKLSLERKTLLDKAKKDAADSIKLELADLKEQLEEKARGLEKSREMELELRKQQRKLEEDKKSFELEMARKMDAERQSIAEKISRDVEDNHRLREAEKDKQLTDLRKQIEEMKRKAEQGSRQIQGEVLELEIENILKENFPFDEIVPVSKGVKGGDVIQTVKTQSGRICGKILWETKRTKVWSDGWIQKLKDDQREAKADLSVIVS
jgi:hypothetical protein